MRNEAAAPRSKEIEMNFSAMEAPRKTITKTDIFELHESAVRSYCRDFPAVFTRALGPHVWDEERNVYLDFLSGAGTLNYGHNHPAICSAVIRYLENNGIVHALDLHTQAKRTFIEAFQRIVLKPRNLQYRLQFTGPTGTNAVEAALKLARKITGRHTVIAFTNAFHGMSLGALAASANASKRAGAGLPLPFVMRMPFDNYAQSVDSIGLLETYLDDPGSGIDKPAAIILETVQAEGGIRVASPEWLTAVAAVARRHQIPLIVDEIQTGCGRTGTFFSFERAGLYPDIVCVSKAIGGCGLPLAIVLIKPHLDLWAPGEHNGTFRGNNLAFVAATAALELWCNSAFEQSLADKAALMSDRLQSIAAASDAEHRGIGLIQGLRWRDAGVAAAVSRHAFERGLIAETCGARNDVLKLLPPLTIEPDELSAGLDILETSIREVAHILPRHSTNELTALSA
jgi:diaminobutyrate-2-oxoglutarate transaminase